ncbi:hypothetical protein M758_2G244700 [Ceratodon purpureus]|nr:hypothetical protein M758_2G244700 [Ceratodon purpureus]
MGRQCRRESTMGRSQSIDKKPGPSPKPMYHSRVTITATSGGNAGSEGAYNPRVWAMSIPRPPGNPFNAHVKGKTLGASERTSELGSGLAKQGGGRGRERRNREDYFDKE